MGQRKTEDAAKNDLLKIAKVRHQVASAKMARLARDLRAAERKEQAMDEQLDQLRHETKLIQAACLDKVTDNLHGIAIYQGQLRVIDLEIRRTEVRKEMLAEECSGLRSILSTERKQLEHLEIRVDLYKKMLRQVKIKEIDRIDDQD
ncbi:hypothetical protein [Dyella nitratireducens]|uniref:Type III secretion protein n=1 Tax=Dyella nitratireducens TaxID=1849580 RepID=A0ABQ1FN38_9GAMM|nr:hypothetical protein [Dyella nitratireducens]GGA23385.1 hypothetical protein GCM10010981_09620 [Dyella nitratireducens]GLQ43975.1 hypothetical protein GCM10007902_38250 [Dyella nitratireducens]